MGSIFVKKIPLPKFIGSEESDTVILFIHGLGGNSNTWSKFTNHLKLNWKENDSFILEYDEYYERLTSIPVFSHILIFWSILRGKDISNLSKHLKTVINQNCQDYENLIIICHSMVGLIARKYMVDKLKKDKNLGNIKCLITYATPHHGSLIGNLFSIFLYYPLRLLYIYKFLQVYELSKNSNFIKSLNQDWSDFHVEDKIDFIRIYGQQDWVVKPESASYKNDDGAHPVSNKNHFSIIKPLSDISDAAFKVTYNYLKNFRLKLEREKEYIESYEDNFE